jgi:hypothetical protein
LWIGVEGRALWTLQNQMTQRNDKQSNLIPKNKQAAFAKTYWNRRFDKERNGFWSEASNEK